MWSQLVFYTPLIPNLHHPTKYRLTVILHSCFKNKKCMYLSNSPRNPSKSVLHTTMFHLTLSCTASLTHTCTPNHQAQQRQKETQNPMWVTSDPVLRLCCIWRERRWRRGGTEERKEQPGVQKHPEQGTQGKYSLFSGVCTSQALHNPKSMHTVYQRRSLVLRTL